MKIRLLKIVCLTAYVLLCPIVLFRSDCAQETTIDDSKSIAMAMLDSLRQSMLSGALDELEAATRTIDELGGN